MILWVVIFLFCFVFLKRGFCCTFVCPAKLCKVLCECRINANPCGRRITFYKVRYTKQGWHGVVRPGETNINEEFLVWLLLCHAVRHLALGCRDSQLTYMPTTQMCEKSQNQRTQTWKSRFFNIEDTWS